MNVDEVLKRVADIAHHADDDEMAHIKEDDLFADLLRAIAAGACDDPQACAEAALASLGIKFSRWHA